MNYSIREMSQNEYELLNDFLYEAIFVPEGVQPPPKSSLLSYADIAHYAPTYDAKLHSKLALDMAATP